MKITENNKFLLDWKYYEVARYVGNLDRVIREKDKILLMEEIAPYASKYANVGIYSSVFAYNSSDLQKATRLGPLYFDLDNSDFSVAYNDCISLYSYLRNYIPENSILVYFTGKKGFHVECEPVALGINPSNSLPKTFRFIASKLKSDLSLESLDFSVYDLRRMWRLPGSKHQSTGLYKTLLNPLGDNTILINGPDYILNYAKEAHEVLVSDQEFNYKANEWYRGNIYEMEEASQKKVDPIEYFNKYGSRAFKDLKKTEKVFDREALLNGCKAVARLKKQAEDKKFLEHEARLFLCSILTYTEDSIMFLHEILSNCSDYSFEKSSAHINDWVKRRELEIGGRPFTCDRANSVGVGCGECSLEKKNKWIQVGGKFVETNEKSSPSPIRYAYTTKKKEDKNEDKQSR